MHTVREQNQFTYTLSESSKPIHIHTVCILSEDKTNSHTHCMHTVREDKTNSHTRCTHAVRGQKLIYKYTTSINSNRTKPHSNVHCETYCQIGQIAIHIIIHFTFLPPPPPPNPHTTSLSHLPPPPPPPPPQSQSNCIPQGHGDGSTKNPSDTQPPQRGASRTARGQHR